MFKKIIIALSITNIIYAHAQDFYLNAEVKSATVYFDSAEVIRQAKINLPSAGTHKVIINNISGNANLNIELDGATLINQVNQTAENYPEKLSANEKLLAELKADLAICEKNIAVHEKLANSLARFDKTKEYQDLNQKMENLAKVSEKIRDLHQIHIELKEKIKEIEKIVAQENSHKSKNNDQIFLQVYTDKPSEATIKIKNIENAYWIPSSQIELDTKKQELNIKTYADIIQNTGENWENVDISLSVTPPEYRESAAFIEKKLRLIDKPEKTKALASGIETIAADEDDAIRVMTLEAVEKNAEHRLASNKIKINTTGLDFTLDLAGKYTLKNDNTASLLYQEEKIPTQEFYSAIYEWDNSNKAILNASWIMPNKLVVLPGSIKIKRDGLLLTSKHIDQMWPAGSKQNLSFGIDPAFSVSKISPSKTNTKSGLIGKYRVEENKQIFNIVANETVDRELRLYARLPTATVSEITVEGKYSKQPSQKNPDNHRNFLLWQIPKLKAGEKWDLDFSYTVKYPADKILK